MVKVEIVEEKDAGASPYASSDSSRTSSSASLSSVESELSIDETFFDRLTALVDIVPPTTRHTISSRISKTASFLKHGGKIAGNIVWVVTTSALLVALPLALSLEDEAKIVAQEKEMMEQQQGAQQVRAWQWFAAVISNASFSFISQMLSPSMYPAPPGSNPNQPPQKGLVPPGF
jgi:import receptor subunit TOM22